MVFNKRNTINDPRRLSYGSIPEMIVTGSDEASALLESNANSGTGNSETENPSGNGKGIAREYLITIMLLGMVLLLQLPRPRDALSNMLPDEDLDTVYDSSTILLDEAFDDKALYYDDQRIDHLHNEYSERGPEMGTYSQRYYKRSKHFRGPGSPILLIMGGEAALELPMLYPFVNEGLSSEFGAFVVSPEHRFYGESQPVGNGYPSVPEMMAYLSPDQALEDAIRLIVFVRQELGCHPDQNHPDYCPVITVSRIETESMFFGDHGMLPTKIPSHMYLVLLFCFLNEIKLFHVMHSLVVPTPAFCRACFVFDIPM